MKKIFMIAAAAMVSLSMSAQVYVGGTLGISTSKASVEDIDISGTSFTFNPEIGYNLNDEWAIGVNLGYSSGISAMGNISLNDIAGTISTVASTATELLGSDDLYDLSGKKLNLSGFTFAPYARYTYLKSGRLELFVDGMVGYSNLKAKLTGKDGSDKVETEAKVNMFDICLRPGFAVRVSDNFRLIGKVGYVGYQSASVDAKEFIPSDPDIKITRAGLNLNANNIVLGATYTF